MKLEPFEVVATTPRQHINTFLQKTFLQEPRLRWGAFRYGFLAFLIGLTIFSAITAAHLPPSASGRYFGFLIPPSLLLNHLAFQFRWPRLVRIGLRVSVILWLGVVFTYIFFVEFTK
jgi:hypothetical protein